MKSLLFSYFSHFIFIITFVWMVCSIPCASISTVKAGNALVTNSSGVARGGGQRWSLTIRWPVLSFANIVIYSIQEVQIFNVVSRFDSVVNFMIIYRYIVFTLNYIVLDLFLYLYDKERISWKLIFIIFYVLSKHTLHLGVVVRVEWRNSTPWL